MMREFIGFAPTRPDNVNRPEEIPYKVKSEYDKGNTVGDLEQAEPGCTDYLKRNYNIEHIARYPEQILLDMYRRRDKDMPWGIVFVAKADHNGAFYHQKALGELHQEIGDRFQTMIVEVGSPEEAIRKMSELREKRGHASYAVIEAHGNEAGFNFGHGENESEEPGQTGYREPTDPPKDEPRHIDVSLQKFARSLGDNLSEGAGICFNSCSTGKDEDSIAPQIASVSGKETTAPTSDTALINFNPEISGKVVKFNPEYRNSGARKTDKGSK